MLLRATCSVSGGDFSGLTSMAAKRAKLRATILLPLETKKVARGNTKIFFPQIEGKPYLEVLSRLGLWRDFLNNNNNNNIQATISVFRLVKNMSINVKSVEFHHCHAKPHSICFLTHIKDNEGNLCQDLLTIENTNLDLKVHPLHYVNELLLRFRLSFQKLLQTRSTRRNNWWFASKIKIVTIQ